MAPHKKCLVLRHHISRDEVERLAWDMGWILVEVGDNGAEVYVDIWATPDEEVEIHYVEDHPIGLHYFVLHGKNTESVKETLVTTWNFWSAAQALRAFRHATNHDDKLIGLYAVALTAPPEPASDVLEVLRLAASDPDPGVRQAVIVATGYLGWPELVELVEQIHHDDPVSSLRANAGILLEGLHQNPRG
jgi:hypothetical protein